MLTHSFFAMAACRLCAACVGHRVHHLPPPQSFGGQGSSRREAEVAANTILYFLLIAGFALLALTLVYVICRHHVAVHVKSRRQAGPSADTSLYLCLLPAGFALLALGTAYIICRRCKALEVKAAADATQKWLLPFCNTPTTSNNDTTTTTSSGDPARRLLGIHRLAGYSPGPSSGNTTQ
jgi:hypothetical protein